MPRFNRRAAPAIALGLVASLSAAAVMAQAPHAVEIEMSNFRYSPASIRLEHGQAYRLHFVNTSGGGHDFTAKAFFAAAQVAPEDRPRLSKGAVALGGHEEVTIRLTAPAAGRYKVNCSHFMHSTFGMIGEIIVA